MTGTARPSPARLSRERRVAHWKRTRRLTVLLLMVWIGTGFCTAFFARELAGFTVFGWPLSFYMAAQGCSLVYLGLIAYYAWSMRRHDRASHESATA